MVLLADAPFLMTIAIALLRERLRAVSTTEGSRLIVSANVVFHIGHLSKHLQANFALTALILTTSFFVDDHHRAPEFFLADDCRFFTSECQRWKSLSRRQRVKLLRL